MEPFELFIGVMLFILTLGVGYLVVLSPKTLATRKQSRRILLDTSVLIDGRITTIARSGFIGGTLVIPRSVIGELQYLADAADHDKRARARFGLDIVAELQGIPEVDVEILQDGSKADEGVDERLLNLAKKHGMAICTLDYNLNKVALVETIAILNVNELAKGLRMAYLPGERVHLELVQKGQDAHQAVGYLPDGTMVVVEHANKSMGQTVEVEIIRSLQTAAGRMMFAKQLGRDTNNVRQQQPAAKKRTAAPAGQPRDSKAQGRSPRPQRAPQKKRMVRSDPESTLIDLVENL
jgi:uncharacterized protein YacL